jgi:hypothetical protein
VGWQTLPNDDSRIHASLWQKGKITDLKTVKGDQCSLASSVNLRGQVVGVSSADCSFQDPNLHAFVSEHGNPAIDLNTLIPPNSGVELRNAMFINDSGEIAAVGWFPDGHHAPVLLVPCDRDGSSCKNTGPYPQPRYEHSQAWKESALHSNSGGDVLWTKGFPGARFKRPRFNSEK